MELARMAAIEWHEGLNVGMAFMDDDHAEAARLINTMAASAGPERIQALRHFIDHCREHFAREEAMMAKTGFFAQGCHAEEHSRVLAELDGVLARLLAGDGQDAYFATALPDWLMNHRNTMDLVTAQFARSAGYTG
ncbi:MAG TPA: hemerythrin domain-containing protein [Magnetospirillum sp.]|nr:hemerythrin domain-containing protein [Magnetospirillum sp.]